MHETTFLLDILILLSAAVFVVAIFRHLNLSPVLGYLVAGAAIGPHGLAIIEGVENTRAIAEFGVVFLLFMIGLELTFERLKTMRKHVFGFGSLQVILTGIAIGGVALYYGNSIEAAIIMGGGLALSSTAVVLQVIAERGEQNTQVGRLSLATLLLQDFAVVPLLVLVPLLAERSDSIGSVLVNAGLKAMIAMVLIFIAGRLLLRPLFRLIASAKSEDLFGATTLLIVLGASWATENAGLSLALGAFIAGLLVAETEYHHQVEADITPFKGIFLGLFFMTVGMSINMSLILDKLELVAFFSIGVLMIKTIIIMVLSRLFGFALGSAIHAGLLLAQGGEFAFILFGLAASQGLFADVQSQILLTVVTLTMATTPMFAAIGKNLADRIASSRRQKPDNLSKETLDLEKHVIIAGYGRMGRTVASMLTTEKVNFIALDSDPKNVTEGRKHGAPVYYGNARRLDVLNSVGIQRAKAIIITVNDVRITQDILASIHRSYPDLPVICRAPDMSQGKKLEKMGATIVVPETFEASLQVGGALLKAMGIADHEIIRVIDQQRSRDYTLTRSEIADEKAERVREIIRS